MTETTLFNRRTFLASAVAAAFDRKTSYGKACAGGDATKGLILLGCIVLWAVVSAGDVAFRRPQHCCYRSFMKELATTRRFADGGIALRCFTVGNTMNSVGEPYCEYPVVWKAKDVYDWQTIDREFQDLVDASPEAKFLVLLDVNTPPWLQRRLRYDSFSVVSIAAADPEWISLTLSWIDAFVAHAEKKWGPRIVGYVLGGGNCTEWTELDYRGEAGARVFSLPFQDLAWRKWCAKRGVDHGPFTPRADELDRAAFRNTIYDPATEGAKIDFWRFRNENVASALLTFAHAVKKVAPSKEVGAFFGYYLLCNPNMYNSWNHMDYERVYDSPDIDFVITPGNYTGRACGGGTGTLLVQGSLTVRGKRLFHEIDFWSHGVRPRGKNFSADYFKTEADDLAGQTREAAFAIVTHASYWWFDMWGGFYESPALFDRIVKLEHIRRRFADDVSPSRADVLFVADPESAYATNEKSKLMHGFPWSVRDELARTGFAADYYSVSDLGKIDLSRYRVVLFPGLFVLSPSKERFVRERICNSGRTVVWFFAPGISDGKTLDESRVARLTGCPLGGTEVVEREFQDWHSIYVPDYERTTLDVQRFAAILKRAGAHAYADCPVVVHANARLLSLHLKDGGRRTVRLPCRVAKVRELLSDRVVAENATAFEYEFQSPDTRLFELEEIPNGGR